MAKDKSEKREKKEKKEKRSEKDGVHKHHKKEKESSKLTENPELTTKLLNNLETEKPNSVVLKVDEKAVVVKVGRPVGALVPFANPLADEKVAVKHKALKRGVKEVVKSLRKSPLATAVGSTPHGVVILAADISPIDVISHIPVLCEDHGVPYIYITSRAELGAASSTKRPTSVVMVTPDKTSKKKPGEDKIDEEDDFGEVYHSLVKVVEKESRNVKI
ncbi:MAG: snoRNA-binding protein [Cirrosporium novae-zelandiae]|nr:MAG: snoRNA-binding protein [Cirrosporium novae-zelandiae]